MADQTSDGHGGLASEYQEDDQRPSAAPRQPQPEDGDDGGEDHAQAGGEVGDSLRQTINPALLAPASNPKKKKKKRTKSLFQRGLDKPTGFEEFYTDPPITAEQNEEDRSLYSLSLPFVDRILTAIQRFERTRKLMSVRRDVFYKYLAYGGIDIAQNMFQGLDLKLEAAQDMDKNQLASALARTSISADKRENLDMYAVDFTGCVAGFLSRRASACFGLDTSEQVSVVTTTLERFMDYLLQHNVSPEYHDDVLRARNLCRSAAAEMWCVAEAQRKLPGNFNAALSTLFDGQFARNYDGETDWSTVGTNMMGQSTDANSFIGFTDQVARQIVSLGIAGAAEEQVYQDFMSKVKDGSLAVIERKERVGFEITRIESSTKECKDLYQKTTKDFKPVGCVYAQAWCNPEVQPEDLTEEECRQAQLSTRNSTDIVGKEEGECYAFLVEENLHSILTIGMKVEASIHRLNCGSEGARSLWFFDEVIQCFPSFDRYLVNEMMVGYKEPRPVQGAIGYVDKEGKWVLYGEGEGPKANEDDWVTNVEKEGEAVDAGEMVREEDGGQDKEQTPPAGVV